MTSDEDDVASLAAMSASSLPLIPWWDGTQAMIMSLLARYVKICRMFRMVSRFVLPFTFSIALITLMELVRMMDD